MKPFHHAATCFAVAFSIGLLLVAPVSRADEHVELFRRLDANIDGHVTESEIPPEHRVLFERLLRKADGDNDRMLSLAEFRSGLTTTRPDKPLPQKIPNQLPGADALLLMLAWMDRNADLVITPEEVPPDLRPLFDEFVDFMNLQDHSELPVRKLSQQAMQYAGRAARFATREGIDVKVELALLSDEQWAYVERLRTSLRGRRRATAKPSKVPPASASHDSDGASAGNGVADRAADPLAKTTQRAGQLLRRYDANGDERLSRLEAPPRIAKRFTRFDKNDDGELDSTEIARVVEILARVRNSTNRASEPDSPPQVSGKNRGEN